MDARLGGGWRGAVWVSLCVAASQARRTMAESGSADTRMGPPAWPSHSARGFSPAPALHRRELSAGVSGRGGQCLTGRSMRRESRAAEGASCGYPGSLANRRLASQTLKRVRSALRRSLRFPLRSPLRLPARLCSSGPLDQPGSRHFDNPLFTFLRQTRVVGEVSIGFRGARAGARRRPALGGRPDVGEAWGAGGWDEGATVRVDHEAPAAGTADPAVDVSGHR